MEKQDSLLSHIMDLVAQLQATKTQVMGLQRFGKDAPEPIVKALESADKAIERALEIYRFAKFYQPKEQYHDTENTRRT
jgi:hypothetical protein